MTAYKTPQEIQEEKRRQAELVQHRNNAIGLIGAGGALAGLGSVVMNGADEQRILNMRGGSKTLEMLMGTKPTFNQKQQYLHAYGEAGHSALQATPFGVPARKFIEWIRKSPLVGKEDSWKGEASALHYDAFTRGPLYGYLQVLNEKTHDGKLFGGDTLKAEKNRLAFQKDLVERVNGISRSATGRDAVYGMETFPHTQNMQKLLANPGVPLSMDQQRKIMSEISETRKLTGWFSPIFASRYRQTVDATQNTARDGFANYGNNLGAKLIKMRHGLQGAGIAIGGAGIGLGAYYLAKQYQARAKRKAHEAAQFAAWKRSQGA